MTAVTIPPACSNAWGKLRSPAPRAALMIRNTTDSLLEPAATQLMSIIET
jgi:hypothetical protein